MPPDLHVIVIAGILLLLVFLARRDFNGSWVIWSIFLFLQFPILTRGLNKPTRDRKVEYIVPNEMIAVAAAGIYWLAGYIA